MNYTFFGYLNDLSGSTRILRSRLGHLNKESNFIVYFLNSKDSVGLLSDIDKKFTRTFNQFRSKTLTFLIYQLQIIFSILFSKNKTTLIFETINNLPSATILSLFGYKCILNIHEFNTGNRYLNTFLTFIANYYRGSVFYVSSYLKKNCQIKFTSSESERIINNGIILPQKISSVKKSNKLSVILVCSFRDFKGIYKFVDLAKEFLNYDVVFTLYTTNILDEVEYEKYKASVPSNMLVYRDINEIELIYYEHDVILSMTCLGKRVETFGLTILEGMAYGLVPIIPNVGGFVDFVQNDFSGLIVENCNFKKAILKLISQPKLFKKLRVEAYKKSKDFDHNLINNKFFDII